MLPDAEGALAQDMHLFVPSPERTQPKSIVMPARTETFQIHTIGAAFRFHRPSTRLGPSFGYFKHVRGGSKPCSADLRAQLADDSHTGEVLRMFSNDTQWGGLRLGSSA